MRQYILTLITLLCLAAVFSNTAYARKHRVPHKTGPTTPQLLKTDSVSADSILQFAQSLIGIRYRIATSNPLIGFDCSGFVGYVFKKFNFNVPRSSYEFISVGEKISLEDAKPGDIILFTGTKKHTRKIGHIAIVLFNWAGSLKFIHSTSGKEHGVTITAMDDTYRHRFVQIIRLLKQNNAS
jgi:lipoprotein Spr